MMGEAPAVLIIEDEWLIAEAIARQVRRLGYSLLGPAASVAEAMAVLEGGAPAAAIVDTILGHETCFSVAERLLADGTPFVFVAGYSTEDIPERFRTCRLISKPFSETALEATLNEMVPIPARRTPRS